MLSVSAVAFSSQSSGSPSPPWSFVTVLFSLSNGASVFSNTHLTISPGPTKNSDGSGSPRLVELWMSNSPPIPSQVEFVRIQPSGIPDSVTEKNSAELSSTKGGFTLPFVSRLDSTSWMSSPPLVKLNGLYPSPAVVKLNSKAFCSGDSSSNGGTVTFSTKIWLGRIIALAESWSSWFPMLAVPLGWIIFPTRMWYGEPVGIANGEPQWPESSAGASFAETWPPHAKITLTVEFTLPVSV